MHPTNKVVFGVSSRDIVHVKCMEGVQSPPCTEVSKGQYIELVQERLVHSLVVAEVG